MAAAWVESPEPGLSLRARRQVPGGTTGNFCVCPPALGTFAILSLMTGSAVERLVPEPLAGNLSGIEREQLDAQRVGAAAALAFGSGALMVREAPGDACWGPGIRPGERVAQPEVRGDAGALRSGCSPVVTGRLPPAARDVRAAAGRPVHLSVGAGG